MYINCEEHGYKNWVFDVKKILIDLGFFDIWSNQKINNGILQLVKQRIFDQAKQDIFANVENSKKMFFLQISYRWYTSSILFKKIYSH